MNRTTPDNITELKPDEIFVFGSNESGRHGAGAAKTAMQWGAVYGKGWGRHGQTFAIPTLDGCLQKRELNEIGNDLLIFAYHARQNFSHTFLVTEIGCGLAGFTPEEIAPLFRGCVELPNVYLPKRFWEVLNRS